MLKNYITLLTLVFSNSLALAMGNFEEFSTREEAISRRASIALDLGLSIEAVVLPSQNYSGYARAQAIANLVTAQFNETFSLDAYKNAWVIIVDDNRWGAQVFGGLEAKPLFIEINSGALSASDDSIKGLIAHELAHLYLQTQTFPEVKYYFTSDLDYNKFLLGDIEGDKILENSMSLWSFYSGFAGISSNADFRGLPYSYDVDSSSDWDLLLQLAVKAKPERLSECGTFLDEYIKIMDTFFLLTTSDTSGILTEEDSKLINDKALRVEDLLKICLPDPINILNESAELDGVSALDLSTYVNELINSGNDKGGFTKSVLSFYSAYSAGEAMIKTINLARKEMREIESRIDFKNLRVFTHEDHADIVATKILVELKINVDPYLMSMSSIFGYCINKPEQEPYYGPIDWEHHSKCWRWWRGDQFYQFFSD